MNLKKVYIVTLTILITYLVLIGFLFIKFSNKTKTVTEERSDNLNTQVATTSVVEETTELEANTVDNSKVTKTKKKSKKKNRWKIKLTDYETELLCQIVMLESGGESDKGQQAVVEVIFNRMYSDSFPNTLESVLSQNGQFVTWKYRNSAKVTKKVRKNVKKVLQGKTNILPYNTLYFSVSPMNSKVQAHIGGHYFCNQ